jgi:hypothetical protein
MRRVALTLYFYLREYAFDFIEIFFRKLEVIGFQIFFQSMDLCGSWYRNNPRLPGKHPGQRNL